MQTSHVTTIVIIGALLVWSIFRRVQRTIGFQRYLPRRMVVRTVTLGVVGLLILAAGIQQPIIFLPAVIGLLAGVVLAYFAARTTTFETRANGLYYRPNAWIGGALLVLFVGRLVLRMVLVSGDLSSHPAGASTGNVSTTFSTYGNDPWTSIFFFVLIGYYIAYYILVAQKARHQNDDEPSQNEQG